MQEKGNGMNNIQIFNNPDFGEIRTIIIDGEPWFVGNDCAKALGYKNLYNGVNKNVDEEDRRVSPVGSASGIQPTTLINESGLYSLIFGSKLESAKRFKKWVTSEVLPSIRRTGNYGLPRLSDDPLELLEVHYQAIKQVNDKAEQALTSVEVLENRFNKFEDELPVTGADMDDIQSAIRKKGIEVMGGRGTNAYQDNSTRGYVYADIQRELRRQFGVKRYKEIKHKDAKTAVNIVRKYELPLVLKDRVDMENAQGKLEL